MDMIEAIVFQLSRTCIWLAVCDFEGSMLQGLIYVREGFIYVRCSTKGVKFNTPEGCEI